jgi:hypothetical protein
MTVAATVLRCGQDDCGRQAATARRSPGPRSTTILLEGRFRRRGGRWWDSRRGPAWASTVDVDDRHDWPVRWDCPHCGTRLVLERDDARRVGTCPRLMAQPDSTP